MQDEPFHVPQTQRYCRGDFATWDPKITTFPGLYIAGMAWAHLLHVGSQAVALVTGGQPATVVSPASVILCNELCCTNQRERTALKHHQR